MQIIKTAIRSAIRTCGYEFSRFGVGKDPFYDMRNLAPDASVVFDIGANFGQTTMQFRKVFKYAEIHCFEPSQATFSVMSQRLAKLHNVHMNNVAVGSRVGSAELNEHSDAGQSSILESDQLSSSIIDRTQVPVTTLDEYCKFNSIERIDILKSDTQGYDLQVLQGASRLLSEQRVHLVFMEINFAPLYKNQGSLDDIYGFLRRHGFALVSFYPIAYDKNGMASWADALFINLNHK